MLGENSEMGIPSSILHAVKPLALIPLGGHPLSDYQMLCSGLCYFTFILYLLSNLFLLILTTSCPGIESCWLDVCELCI